MAPHRSSPAAVLMLLLLVGCTPSLAPSVTAPSAAPSPTPALASAQPPSLLAYPWQDRSAFRLDLIDSEVDILNQYPGATVYHLDIRIADDLGRVDGRAEILYTNQESTSLEEVCLHLFANLLGGSIAVSQVEVDGQAVTPLLAHSDSLLRVPLPSTLTPGHSAVLRLAFTTLVPSDQETGYGVVGITNGILSLAHFYPMVAVYDPGGWDTQMRPEQADPTYADVAYFLVRVEAPADLQVASSGRLIDTQSQGSTQERLYAAGPARDFFLAAHPAYQVVEQQAGSAVIRSSCLAEFESASREAARVASQALETFSGLFGPFPYMELDIVCTGMAALGVEYPGIIAINAQFYDPNDTDLPKSWFEATVAHEVAHQWFYATVGNDQVSEPWLDESLVQYATLLYFEDQYGQPGADGFRNALYDRWDRVERANIPIGLPVAAYQGREYGAIVYGRGALFFEALADQIGEDAARAFLRQYFETYKWGIATTEGLRQLAEDSCRCDLTGLFEAWVYPQ